MHLVQIILPLYTNDGNPIARELFNEVRERLLERFGGVTAFTRAPAEGLWQEGKHVQRDDVLLYEVMVESIDRGWWLSYRTELERKFHQQEIVVRAHAIERF